MSVLIKICGLTDKVAVEAAVSAGADFIGFVFYPPSPRHLPLDTIAELSKHKLHAKSVVVTVDGSDDDFISIMKHVTPDYIQLHGDETPDRAAQIRQETMVPIIKAIKVRNADDIAQAKSYLEVADMLLFDARVPEASLPGGNGLSFDWHLLQGRSFSNPWFLSGGLNAENVTDAIRITHAPMVDASSALEISPGKKNVSLIAQFIRTIQEMKHT